MATTLSREQAAALLKHRCAVISFDGDINDVQIFSGSPAACVPILHFLFVKFSAALGELFINEGHNFEEGMSDEELISGIIRVWPLLSPHNPIGPITVAKVLQRGLWGTDRLLFTLQCIFVCYRKHKLLVAKANEEFMASSGFGWSSTTPRQQFGPCHQEPVGSDSQKERSQLAWMADAYREQMATLPELPSIKPPRDPALAAAEQQKWVDAVMRRDAEEDGPSASTELSGSLPVEGPQLRATAEDENAMLSDLDLSLHFSSSLPVEGPQPRDTEQDLPVEGPQPRDPEQDVKEMMCDLDLRVYVGSSTSSSEQLYQSARTSSTASITSSSLRLAGGGGSDPSPFHGADAIPGDDNPMLTTAAHDVVRHQLEAVNRGHLAPSESRRSSVGSLARGAFARHYQNLMSSLKFPKLKSERTSSQSDDSEDHDSFDDTLFEQSFISDDASRTRSRDDIRSAENTQHPAPWHRTASAE